MKIQLNPKGSSAAKSKSDWATTIILVLLIAIAIFGIMTVKKFFEAQQTTLNEVELKEATAFVEDNPDNLEGRLALAYSLQTAERYDEAREQYEEVLTLDPMNQGAKYNLGEIARINKDYKEAETILKDLLENYKYHVLGSISLAQVYNETKRYDEAVKLMDFMISAVPQIMDLHVAKGNALEKKGDKAKAISAYEQALKYDPDNTKLKESIAKLKQK